MEIIKALGYNVFSDDLSLISIKDSKSKDINTISPNSYGLATKDEEFNTALKTSDYLVLDGVGFALASIILKGKNMKRNQGPDVFYHFMKRLNEQNGKVFFLGSTEDTLGKIKDRAAIDYPNITIETYSPPFTPNFSEVENDVMLSKVNTFQPNILFVGMTCPKQEKWTSSNKTKVNANLICSVGAVFDWYAGNQPEISQIWWTLRLGWVKRIIDRPELIKRNIPNAMIFLKHLFLALFGIKKY
jgi:N-acetylglucosaminyldiphosphoundecaprenol N-acetyl-beta-D-mannosaminyltransferase